LSGDVIGLCTGLPSQHHDWLGGCTAETQLFLLDAAITTAIATRKRRRFGRGRCCGLIETASRRICRHEDKRLYIIDAAVANNGVLEERHSPNQASNPNTLNISQTPTTPTMFGRKTTMQLPRSGNDVEHANQNEDDAQEYPTGIRLFLIMISLYIGIFLVALVNSTQPAPSSKELYLT
jgi:hypothetical protein